MKKLIVPLIILMTLTLTLTLTLTACGSSDETNSQTSSAAPAAKEEQEVGSNLYNTSQISLNMATAEQTNKLLEAYWTSHIEYAPEIAKELLHPEYLEKGSMAIDEQIDSLKSEGAKITFETDGTAARNGSSTLGMTVFITHPTEGELKYYMTFKETEKKNNEWRISNVKEMEDE